MSDTLLLTGATGFLGMTLIARLLEDDDGPDLILPVRARDTVAASARVDEILATLYDTPPAAARRLRAVPADITEPGLGLSSGDRRDILTRVDRIVHCAASISFTLPLDEARLINVSGTGEVLDLAYRMPHLERVVHVSTAYVAGRAEGFFGEDDHDVGQAFRNTYEQTKWEAEYLVRRAALPTAIVRPSIVVGESDSGWTSAFNVVYWPLQAFARGLLDEVAADPEGIVDLVPVDHVVDVIGAALTEPDARGTYHAVAGDGALRVEQLIEEACRFLDRPPPKLTAAGGATAAEVFAPYFDVRATFRNERSIALAGSPALDALGPRILSYAHTTRWGKRPMTRQAARARLPEGISRT